MLACLAAPRAHAVALYIPEPQLIWSPGILASALSLGGGGLSLLTHGGNARSGGSFMGVQGSFPLRRTDEPRISGWSWGFGAGVTGFINDRQSAPRPVFAPSTYYWELMLGRGTTEPLTGAESGLRGYMEFVLRDQAPQRLSEVNSFTFVDPANHRFVPNHRRTLAVRMGAGNDPDGTGLVAQRPPYVQFNLQAAIYAALPSREVKRTYVVLQGRGLVHCGWDWLKCGLGVNYLNSPEAIGNSEEGELARQFALGPRLQGRWDDRYALALDAQWSWMTGYRSAPKHKVSEHRSSGVPAISLALTAAF